MQIVVPSNHYLFHISLHIMSTLKQLLPANQLSETSLDRIATYFQILSEPSRLRLLNFLCTDEASVGDLATATKLSTANVSRHLTLMAKHGLVSKEARGNSVIYSLADDTLHQVCDLVCRSVIRKITLEAQDHAGLIQVNQE
jgi:DNA-binding transcriptional ArsR family regulator